MLGQEGTAGCCPGPLTTPLTAEEAAEEAAEPARVFKALGDPVRLRLLSMVASRAGGEVCVCDLASAFELSQPTISHHLKLLREAGLIEGERRGTWVYYRLVPETTDRLAAILTRYGDRSPYRAARSPSVTVSEGIAGPCPLSPASCSCASTTRAAPRWPAPSSPGCPAASSTSAPPGRLPPPR